MRDTRLYRVLFFGIAPVRPLWARPPAHVCAYVMLARATERSCITILIYLGVFDMKRFFVLFFFIAFYGCGGSSNVAPVGPQWNIETVDDSSNQDVGWYSSLSMEFYVDDEDHWQSREHILHYDLTSSNLKHSSRNMQTGSWENETVDFEGNVGGYPSSLFANGTLHVFYYDYTNRDLKYASRDAGGNWTIDIAGFRDLANNAGRYSSIALNPDDSAIYATYFWDADDTCIFEVCVDELRVTTPLLSEPQSTLLAGEAWDSGTGAHSSLEILEGEFVVSYYREGSTELKFWKSTLPSAVAVDSIGDVGRYSSLEIDTNQGAYYIAYYDSSNGNLKVASSTTGTNWATEVVDSIGDVGEYCSAVFFENQLHIAYLDYTNRNLKYVKGLPGDWGDPVVIDSSGLVTGHISIHQALEGHWMLSPNAYPKISYNSDNKLKLASYR